MFTNKYFLAIFGDFFLHDFSRFPQNSLTPQLAEC